MLTKKFKPREILDETLVNMFTSFKYKDNALFYAHMIAQMNINLDDTLPAPVGVSFSIDHYNLHINENKLVKYSLDDRIFIMIHECLHILAGHLGLDARLKDQNQEIANIAMDCSINQLQTLNTPKEAIVPDNLNHFGTLSEKPKLKQTSEYYYSIFSAHDKTTSNDDKSSKEGNSQGTQENSSGEEGNSHGKLDTHSTWENSSGDPDLQKDITSQMIDKSIQETTKQRGNLPADIQEYTNMFSRKSQIDWKNVLKSITGNKKVGKRPTIMRRSRRFPNRPDIKGHIKDRTFELVVFVDISGSMDNNSIITGLNEVHHICKMNNSTMKLIQIDVKVHKIQDFDESTKIFERTGCGGTIMESGIEYLLKNKIVYDACLFISDMYIEDVRKWKKQPKGRVMWLSTTGNIPEWNGYKNHKVYPIEVKNGK